MTVHPENQALYDEYKHTTTPAYTYKREGQCPRCSNELVKNEFENFECQACYRDYLEGRYFVQEDLERKVEVREEKEYFLHDLSELALKYGCFVQQYTNKPDAFYVRFERVKEVHD